jgi:hypothetical protein
MKRLTTSALVVLLLMAARSSSPCSVNMCSNHGVELRGEFVVRVMHGGRPLAGVSVRVTSFTEQKVVERFFSATATDGTVHVAGLPEGEYWLNAELLGITAGDECFHVSQRASRSAKGKVTYGWGDVVPATRRLAGKLIDSKPGQGGTTLSNFLHRTDVPISDARLTLRDPLTGKAYEAVSGHDGGFAFDSAPQGTYVLHVDAGTVPGGRNYDSADQLIRLSKGSTPNTLLLKWKEAGLGSCGGASMELQSISN